MAKKGASECKFKEQSDAGFFSKYGSPILTVINIGITGYLGFTMHQLDSKLKHNQISTDKRQCLANANTSIAGASKVLTEIIKSRYSCYRENITACQQSIDAKNNWMFQIQDIYGLIASKCDKSLSEPWTRANQQVVAMDSTSLKPNEELLLIRTDELNDTLDQINRMNITTLCCKD